jgi:hypothetical protein
MTGDGTIKVRVPPGVETGVRLRMSGEGEGGTRGGHPGDLYVAITVREHPDFRRDGPHLFTAAALTITQAVLGSEIEVPTLEGSARLAIPPGTQSGSTFALRGKGLPSLATRAARRPARRWRRPDAAEPQAAKWKPARGRDAADALPAICHRVKDIFPDPPRSRGVSVAGRSGRGARGRMDRRHGPGGRKRPW